MDKIINSAVGELMDKNDLVYGETEFLKNALSITSDFESPIKKNKFSLIALETGISDELTNRATNTNINRVGRMVIKTTSPFSLWNSTELVLSMPLIASIGNQIRLIDNKWYTKEQLLNKEISEDKWNKSKNLFDTIEVVNGELDFKDIPEYIKDYYYNKIQSATSVISQKAINVDKGTAYRHSLLKFLTMFTTWLIQSVSKSFKSRSFNYLNNRWEEGYFTKDSLKYTLDILKSAISLDKQNVKDLLDYSINPQNSGKIRNFYRLSIQMGTVTILSALAYIMIGLSLEDDDDDEIDNKFIQILALLSMKLMMEQGAKISGNDLYEYAKNPLGNFDRIFALGGWVDAAIQYLFPEEEKETNGTRRSIYDGMPKWMKTAIVTTPYVKGLFESYFGAYINEAITGERIDQAVAYNQKIQGLKRYVVEKHSPTGETFRTLADAFALPSRMLGYMVGERALRIIGADYPESTSVLKLPTKKANEE
jgi:hypothetical protein